MGQERERKRVKVQAEAAAFLGISKTRLQQFHQEAGPSWWQESFRNSDGYDIVGIAKAQAVATVSRSGGSGIPAAERSPLQRQIAEAEAREAIDSAAIKSLERRKRQRLEAVAEKELVQAEIVVTLFVEALADLRNRLDELPYRFSLQIPEEFQRLVFQSVKDGEPALLEEFVRELIQSFEDFWEVMSSEVFDPPEDDEVEIYDN
ncbi:MAG: hypothetical protein ABJZ55_20360 [Fuerstiella sp.]